MNIKRKIHYLFLKGQYTLKYLNGGWYCCPISKEEIAKLQLCGKTLFKASLTQVLTIEHNLHKGTTIIQELNTCGKLLK